MGGCVREGPPCLHQVWKLPQLYVVVCSCWLVELQVPLRVCNTSAQVSGLPDDERGCSTPKGVSSVSECR